MRRGIGKRSRLRQEAIGKVTGDTKLQAGAADKCRHGQTPLACQDRSRRADNGRHVRTTPPTSGTLDVEAGMTKSSVRQRKTSRLTRASVTTERPCR